MGKFKTWKYRNLFTSIASSTCLVGATAGIIFGISAGTFKVNYINLNSAAVRAKAANSKFSYYSQDIKSQWNMTKSYYKTEEDKKAKKLTTEPAWNPNSMLIKDARKSLSDPKGSWSTWWNELYNNAEKLFTQEQFTKFELNTDFGKDISADAKKARYEYMSMVIDGATHSTMDRSFNQSLYNGIVNFIQNKQIASNDLQPETTTDPTNNCARSFKPSGDQTTSFQEIYASVAQNHRLIGLAGFNHCTPLSSLGKYGDKKLDGDETGKSTNYRVQYDNKNFDKTAFLLIDGEMANNQNISSALFRSDEPGFMAAMATCMYFLDNLDLYHDKGQPLSIGIYGGTSIPTVTIYMGGAERGVEFFNYFVLKSGIVGTATSYITDQHISNAKSLDDVKKNCPIFYTLVQHCNNKDNFNKLIETFIAHNNGSKTMNTQEIADATTKFVDLETKLVDEFTINIIKLGEGPTHFSGTFASGDAIGITKQYLNRGASAIMAVAGPQSLDSAQEILNQKSKCIVIGVDSAMEDGDYQKPQSTKDYGDKSVGTDGSTPKQANNIIKFSAVKDMCSITQKFAELCASDKNFDVEEIDPTTLEGTGQPDPEKAICGIGYKTCGNIRNGLISISEDGWAPFIKAMDYAFLTGNAVGTYSAFADEWVESAVLVCLQDKIIEEVGGQYKPKQGYETLWEEIYTKPKATRSVTNLVTYSKDAVIFKNYPLIIKILGSVLGQMEITVPKDLNVDKPITSTDPETGKSITTYPEAKKDEKMTVLSWLKRNMYFTV